MANYEPHSLKHTSLLTFRAKCHVSITLSDFELLAMLSALLTLHHLIVAHK